VDRFRNARFARYHCCENRIAPLAELNNHAPYGRFYLFAPFVAQAVSLRLPPLFPRLTSSRSAPFSFVASIGVHLARVARTSAPRNLLVRSSHSKLHSASGYATIFAGAYPAPCYGSLCSPCGVVSRLPKGRSFPCHTRGSATPFRSLLPPHGKALLPQRPPSQSSYLLFLLVVVKKALVPHAKMILASLLLCEVWAGHLK